MTGTPAEAKERAVRLLRAWRLADVPGTLLHTKLCSPEHPRGSRTGIDMAHRGLSQASSQLQLLYRLIAADADIIFLSCGFLFLLLMAVPYFYHPHMVWP